MRTQSTFYEAGKAAFHAIAPEMGSHAIAAAARSWSRAGFIVKDAAGRHYIIDPVTRRVTAIESITHV